MIMMGCDWSRSKHDIVLMTPEGRVVPRLKAGLQTGHVSGPQSCLGGERESSWSTSLVVKRCDFLSQEVKSYLGGAAPVQKVLAEL